MFSWGENDHGQLGPGDKTNRAAPQEVIFLKGKPVISISCGFDYSVAVLSTKSHNNNKQFNPMYINFQKVEKFILGETITMDNLDWGTKHIDLLHKK